MKRTTFTLLFITSALLILALGACVRPVPGTQNLPEATATISGISPLLPSVTPLGQQVPPVAPPPGASPTPLPGVIAPAEPTPTPLPAVPEPTQPPAPAPTTAPTGERIHIVQPGENLYRIGLLYGFTYQELATYNGLVNPDVLDVGQQIKIPPKP